MKTLYLLGGLSLFLAATAHAGVLAKYDFNNLSSVHAANEASFVSPCIQVEELDPCCMTEGLRTVGGPDGSAYRSYAGWDVNQYDPTEYLNRTGTWQWPKTLSAEVQVDDSSLGMLSGVSVDLKRPYSYSPDTIMATIFWKDDAGVVQQRNSGPVDISGATSWTNITFDFVNGSEDLPYGLAYGGETFNVELYAWGGSGGALFLDNVTLTGDCAPIPEPGAALLIGMTGFSFLLRRRLR